MLFAGDSKTGNSVSGAKNVVFFSQVPIKEYPVLTASFGSENGSFKNRHWE